MATGSTPYPFGGPISPDQAEPAGAVAVREPAAGIVRSMPRTETSRRYMAAQVQGRTLERQAERLRQLLCRLSGGEGSAEEVTQAADAMRLQLSLAEDLAHELVR